MDEPKTKPGWRIARRILIALAVLATLIAIFYTEEDWRGKHDWEQCKRQLEAQGVVLDWNKFLPPTIPDDQNFYTYNTNFLIFRQLRTDAEVEQDKKISWLKGLLRIDFPIYDTASNGPIIVAKIIVSPHGTALESGSNTLAVSFDDPAAPARVRQLIQSTVGQTINGAEGFEFSQYQLASLRPAQVFMQADTMPSAADLAAFVTSDKIGDRGQLKIVATAAPHIFQVQLTNLRITEAADYIAWSDQYVPDLDDIREALKRPYAILPGDYSVPYQIPIPNFVTMRALSQVLSQRAQCYFLLGEPDKALRELALVHDVCRILEKPPTGQPETLVEAMIDVAIHGLYVAMIAEGFKRHEWQEPQLEALQEQLATVKLLPVVKRSFASEIAASSRDLETIPRQKLREIISIYPGTKKFDLWRTIQNWKESFVPLFRVTFAPRGWIYQNMVTDATLMSQRVVGFDSPEGIVQLEKFRESDRDLNKIPMRYKFIATIMVPNLAKASQTAAYNQTMVNEAQIACALERCYLAHGDYPDTLDALTPGYLATVPQDIIDGQPLHYRRTGVGKFLLYSVGWNERDDGGKVVLNSGGGVNYTAGDWVWLGGIK